MAQFEVFRPASGGDLLIDCQSDLLRHLNTRFVVPLMPLDRAPTPAAKLNPLIDVEGETLSMVTQFAGSVPRNELKDVICSVEDRYYDIMRAIDSLTGGV